MSKPKAVDGWQPIGTAPTDEYVLLTDGMVLPDIAVWYDARPARTDMSGTQWCAVPAGWFTCAGLRSRIYNPTHWMPVPDPSVSAPARQAQERQEATMKILDKYGWPVELIKGRPITNLLRLLLHGRKIVRRWEPPSSLSPRPTAETWKP